MVILKVSDGEIKNKENLTEAFYFFILEKSAHHGLWEWGRQTHRQK